MPIATPQTYAKMLDRAKEHGFAHLAISVTSSQTLNAALRGAIARMAARVVHACEDLLSAGQQLR